MRLTIGSPLASPRRAAANCRYRRWFVRQSAIWLAKKEMYRTEPANCRTKLQECGHWRRFRRPRGAGSAPRGGQASWSLFAPHVTRVARSGRHVAMVACRSYKAPRLFLDVGADG